MKRLKQSFIKWIIVSMICLLLGFLLGKFKQDILLDSLALMEVDLQTLSAEKVELSMQLARNDAKLMTDEQTINQLTQENMQLSKELNISANKLYFYERIVSPELQSSGVKIYSFTVLENKQTGEWNYELVLMQSQKYRRFLSGKFSISFSGLDNGHLQNRALSSLSETSASTFKFKYFQTIKGDFILPPEMTIDEVILQLNVPGNRWYKAQQVTQRYDWKTLIEEEEDISEFEGTDLTSFESEEQQLAP
ncbi:MAG: hypothetical protein ACJAT7_002137 [Psychromonas sp.]|jgi:hypothetical protein|uniref:DUF6776 family protein n=1 Tax=Psychromonas sp. TaxID=1884585 RepID=UPI0039E401AD